MVSSEEGVVQKNQRRVYCSAKPDVEHENIYVYDKKRGTWDITAFLRKH